jgi:hypothetical protein
VNFVLHIGSKIILGTKNTAYFISGEIFVGLKYTRKEKYKYNNDIFGILSIVLESEMR